MRGGWSVLIGVTRGVAFLIGGWFHEVSGCYFDWCLVFQKGSEFVGMSEQPGATARADRINVMLASGLAKREIGERLGVGVSVVRGVWEECEWVRWLTPLLAEGGVLQRSVVELARILNFTGEQYGYFRHEGDALLGLGALQGMVAKGMFVEVVNERRLPATNRVVICFTTRWGRQAQGEGEEQEVVPVWAYLIWIQRCLGGVKCPRNTEFVEALSTFRLDVRRRRGALHEQGKPPTARSLGVVSEHPISCDGCAMTFTQLALLRRHVTNHGHSLPPPFVLKDAWLTSLVATPRFTAYMESVRVCGTNTIGGVYSRLRCYTDWLLVNDKLTFTTPTHVTTTMFDILLDETAAASYIATYPAPATKLNIELAFSVVRDFFTRVVEQQHTHQAHLPGDDVVTRLSAAQIQCLRSVNTHSQLVTKRRRSTLSTRVSNQRMDEDVQAAKRARQPAGLRSAAQDSDYDALLLLTLLHCGNAPLNSNPSTTTVLSPDSVELLEMLFCVIFQIVQPQRPEVLRKLIIGKHIHEVKLWEVSLNVGHDFKTGKSCQALNLTLQHQTGILASLLIRYGHPSKVGLTPAAAATPAPTPYLISNTAGLPYSASTFSLRFKSVRCCYFNLNHATHLFTLSVCRRGGRRRGVHPKHGKFVSSSIPSVAPPFNSPQLTAAPCTGGHPTRNHASHIRSKNCNRERSVTQRPH